MLWQVLREKGTVKATYLLLVPDHNSVQAQQLGDADPGLVAHTAPRSLHQQVVGAGCHKVHQEVFA